MAGKVAFEREANGYAVAQVDAYIDTLMSHYDELLKHYEALQAEVEQAKTAATSGATSATDASTTPTQSDYTAEALELLNETTQVVTGVRKEARAKMVGLIDQTSGHVRRLEDTLQELKDELAHTYQTIEEKL
ncbi:MAG: DivIVA domain-containing protein [Coriobacteriia bacterium]|nr:DivIVA domain-containing protein [Coriobacteriia bacterium]